MIVIVGWAALASGAWKSAVRNRRLMAYRPIGIIYPKVQRSKCWNGRSEIIYSRSRAGTFVACHSVMNLRQPHLHWIREIWSR